MRMLPVMLPLKGEVASPNMWIQLLSSVHTGLPLCVVKKVLWPRIGVTTLVIPGISLDSSLLSFWTGQTALITHFKEHPVDIPHLPLACISFAPDFQILIKGGGWALRGILVRSKLGGGELHRRHYFSLWVGEIEHLYLPLWLDSIYLEHWAWKIVNKICPHAPLYNLNSRSSLAYQPV